MAADEEKKTASDSGVPEIKKKRPPKDVIEKMNRMIIAAAEAGMTPAELEDDIYRRMFGCDE